MFTTLQSTSRSISRFISLHNLIMITPIPPPSPIPLRPPSAFASSFDVSFFCPLPPPMSEYATPPPRLQHVYNHTFSKGFRDWYNQLGCGGYRQCARWGWYGRVVCSSRSWSVIYDYFGCWYIFERRRRRLARCIHIAYLSIVGLEQYSTNCKAEERSCPRAVLAAVWMVFM